MTTTRKSTGGRRMPLLALRLGALLAFCLGTVAVAEPDRRAVQGVTGKVVADAKPLSSVVIYAYEVASHKMREVETDRRGQFLFETLPAGMYKLVAHKPGFVPTVELLLRRTRDERQYIEMSLRREELGQARDAEGYWHVRGRVPVDVLRQIQQVHTRSGSFSGPAGDQLQAGPFLEAQMTASSGVEQLGGLGDAQVTGAEIGLRGSTGGLKMGLDGHFQQLAQQGAGAGSVDGQTQSVALQLQSAQDQQVRLSTTTGELTGTDLGGPIDMEFYQLAWNGRTGDEAEASVSATLLQENNFYRGSGLRPVDVPGWSETFDLEGSYTMSLGETSLRTGLAYQQRRTPGLLEGVDQESLDVFGIAGSQIRPKVFVEYGLYSSVRDGSLSLMPHGGMVVQLGDGWEARTSVSHRVEDESSDDVAAPQRFNSSFFGGREACQRSGEACYEVSFSQKSGSDESIRVGAVHREIAETLQLYFSPDFFDRLESVFLVEGDSVPELQVSLVRRVTPKVLAKLESNIAEGGGGIFYATDNLPYENQVRYLVTSLDTRFQSTSTGVFVAFHHLEQTFNPVDSEKAAMTKMEMQRLQLMLTQDLSILANAASNWAVRLNMELSRGATPYTLSTDDETYKKLTGGFSFSF
ncbi:MAG: carboxypeptidase-like regulatory domain-containing protein [Acidobacteriota bacterium]